MGLRSSTVSSHVAHPQRAGGGGGGGGGRGGDGDEGTARWLPSIAKVLYSPF